MQDEVLRWYRKTMNLINMAKKGGNENHDYVKELYQGWLCDIKKIEEKFPDVKRQYEKDNALYKSFTSQQIDHICYKIGDWYLEWKNKMWVEDKPNEHWLGVAKEQLKTMICGE